MTNDTLLQTVQNCLSHYSDPFAQQTYTQLGWLKTVVREGEVLRINLELGYPLGSLFKAEHKQTLTKLLSSLSPQVDIQITSNIVAHKTQPDVEPIPEVKNVLAIASGKGGVGKSTVAVNLALALRGEGAQVGLLDADIYGPSQTTMLGLTGKPESPDGKVLEPLRSHGLQAMSVGCLFEEQTPLIWRGPIVSRVLQQLTHQTHWQNLDYLILDLPPGTGDLQLTMAQKIPVSGGIIVTTPQTVALQEARRALEMFRKLHIPVLGVVENMSYYTCSQCGHHDPIFDEGGGKQFAQEEGIPLLGELPLATAIRCQADLGAPTVVSEPESLLAHLYREIALKAAAQLACQPKRPRKIFPKIVVESTS